MDLQINKLVYVARHASLDMDGHSVYIVATGNVNKITQGPPGSCTLIDIILNNGEMVTYVEESVFDNFYDCLAYIQSFKKR